jgi:DNA helicase-2/ATP-dependent DNA helicase PcrA
MKIEHQKFGFGVIKEIEGSAHNPIATILFDTNGEKKIMLNYAKLSIIPPKSSFDIGKIRWIGAQ